MNPEETTVHLVEFVRSLGISVEFGETAPGTFLPGITIRDGILIVDRARLQWPGDIVHEAGHIAISPPSQRASMGGKIEVTPAEEMATLAWSYAAALAAGVPPEVVFHEGGYRKGGAQLVAQFASGQPPGGPGVPILQWYGMTSAFPNMTHWLRQTDEPG
jgi:hypothetical protein